MEPAPDLVGDTEVAGLDVHAPPNAAVRPAGPGFVLVPQEDHIVLEKELGANRTWLMHRLTLERKAIEGTHYRFEFDAEGFGVLCNERSGEVILPIQTAKMECV